jgi:hypothetical protein
VSFGFVTKNVSKTVVPPTVQWIRWTLQIQHLGSESNDYIAKYYSRRPNTANVF